MKTVFYRTLNNNINMFNAQSCAWQVSVCFLTNHMAGVHNIRHVFVLLKQSSSMLRLRNNALTSFEW